MKPISIKGVLAGAVTDVASSVFFGLLFGFLAILFFHEFGHVRHTEVIRSSLFYAMLLVIGLACSALGGFVSARIAKHDELLNGTLSSFLCVTLGIYHWASGISHEPIYHQLLLLIAGPVFGLLGGHLRLRQVRRLTQV